MFLCISPGMPFNTLLMLCHYFYFRASLNYFYWTTWRKGHKGKLWLVFIAPMFNAKMALNKGGNAPLSPKYAPFSKRKQFHLTSRLVLRSYTVVSFEFWWFTMFWSTDLFCTFFGASSTLSSQFSLKRRILTAPVWVTCQSVMVLYLFTGGMLCCLGT